MIGFFAVGEDRDRDTVSGRARFLDAEGNIPRPGGSEFVACRATPDVVTWDGDAFMLQMATFMPVGSSQVDAAWDSQSCSSAN